MNHIDMLRLREMGGLDAAGFFHHLIEEGGRLSLISPGQLETLQYQLVELLADRFNRRTSGFSSSVPVETGKSIQQSVFYTVGYYLKSLKDAESALEVLISEPLGELFLRGQKLIDTNLVNAKKLLRFVQQNRLATDVLAYNDTLDAGLPEFFSSYDTDYGAHETPASVDYPLGNDSMNLTGIEYISQYLHKLRLENEFCSRFPQEEIRSLLRGYDRQYKELLFNIYELVLTNAVGCLLVDMADVGKAESGKRYKGDVDGDGIGIGLHISDYGRQFLLRELAPLPEEQIDSRVDAAVSRLCGTLSIKGTPLAGYIRKSSVNLKSRLKHALRTGGLKQLFLPLEDEGTAPSVRFDDLPKMDDVGFRRLADEIRECRLVSDKIALLRKDPVSLRDLVDLLEGYCFYGEEFRDVFASLEDIQLALLIKKLPSDPDGGGFLIEEGGKEWQSELDSYLSQIAPGRKAAILDLASRLKTGSDI